MTPAVAFIQLQNHRHACPECSAAKGRDVCSAERRLWDAWMAAIDSDRARHEVTR